jgi:hypothetical protein
MAVFLVMFIVATAIEDNVRAIGFAILALSIGWTGCRDLWRYRKALAKLADTNSD